jgi:hypothetical protein
MELIKICNSLYLKTETQIFIFDSVWEMFRPIEYLAWNGHEITYNDKKYKEDIFDIWYGFGSENMKLLCQKLTEEIELSQFKEIDGSEFLKKEWFFDRKCTFLPCSKKDKISWKNYLKYLNKKHKTLRKNNNNNKTKRILF